MGEVAEGIVNGLYCLECYGVVDGEETGAKRFCSECGPCDALVVPNIELGKKLVKRLKAIERMTDKFIGRFRGDYWDAAAAQHIKLKRHGLVEIIVAFTPFYRDRVIITDVGRAWLATQ